MTLAHKKFSHGFSVADVLFFLFFFGWLAGWVMICLVQVLVIWMGWLWIGKDWLVGCIWVRFVISGSVYGYWDRFVSYMD